MALVEFVIPPDQASYSVTDGKEVVSTQLDGGAARYRRDILGATSRVAVQWTCGPSAYKYIRSFYRGVTVSGSKAFNIGLILDEPEITTHKVYFIPGSMVLRQQQGLTYIVGAELEVHPAEVSANALEYVTMYNIFGDNWRYDEERFNTLVNFDWPGAL